MKCVIGGAQLRVFGRAIHAIARISDEFWFDPVEKGLALRSVNSSRSAYAYVFFSSMFFQHYCWAAVSDPCHKEKESSLPCKLIVKAVLPVFRCANVLGRNVEKCSISTSPSDHHITFQLLCKHGVVKTYNLTFQECDPLQAVFAKHMCPNILKVHSSQEEITLSVTPVKVCFKSYTEEDTDFSRTMVTEIHLSPEEFDYFQVGVDSELTFCLKELRGLLAFSEATGVPVSIHFDRCGKPIAFSIEDVLLEASLILATLCEAQKEADSQEHCCPQQWGSSTPCFLELFPTRRRMPRVTPSRAWRQPATPRRTWAPCRAPRCCRARGLRAQGQAWALPGREGQGRPTVGACCCDPAAQTVPELLLLLDCPRLRSRLTQLRFVCSEFCRNGLGVLLLEHSQWRLRESHSLNSNPVTTSGK
ncbi:cell cycle checkpoint control protein RAD9B isoform X3 [Manacus candei]|uniref:cell cycle checkpoint control protein RAD9B isoform X3 n=1 Tax=Manacus candei TaxID=415023 RepID=UPI00222618F4|nr:cell cycle checkpoint control protein RAD9B isoform X3 [Manacus candei]